MRALRVGGLSFGFKFFRPSVTLKKEMLLHRHLYNFSSDCTKFVSWFLPSHALVIFFDHLKVRAPAKPSGQFQRPTTTTSGILGPYMKKLFTTRRAYIVLAGLVIFFVVSMVLRVSNTDTSEIITTTIEIGPVRQLVSVSGIAKAEQTAKLAFPVSGVVREVLVDTGDEVQAGDVLITLEAQTLYADRQDALAALTQAVADRDELLEGPTISARKVTAETYINAQETLDTTKRTEAQKVINAYQTLLSSGLTAYSEDIDENATAPTISGTYTCGIEGTYYLSIFNSKAVSGYSFKLTGLETGTYIASTEQPGLLGTCGLNILFDADSTYGNSTWFVDIPNKRSSSYVTNRNTYDLAVTQSETAIALAEQALALAKADAEDQNAPARSEAVTRANAAITQTQARLQRIDASLTDHILTAPFAGMITSIDIVLPGETVTTEPILTLLASEKFEVVARIPEIDIGKLAVGQSTEMVFDARANETVLGSVSFISPEATEIDGVAYYEATIQFQELPTWIRSGLNADIEIIVQENDTDLRVPKRFVTKTETGYEVLMRGMKKDTWTTSTIEVLLEGNDGYYAITGVNEGTVLVAP